MLTGRPPFTDNDAVVVMARHIKSTPKRPNEAVPEAMIPTELEDVVIMRTLAKEPKDRPASAEIFAGELLAALEAQGAQTSGVRASITNAAGIRVPESMRPPPMVLPKPPSRSRLPLLLLAVPLVLVAAAGGVYLGHVATRARHAADAESPPTARPTATRPAEPGAGASAATTASAARHGRASDGHPGLAAEGAATTTAPRRSRAASTASQPSGRESRSRVERPRRPAGAGHLAHTVARRRRPRYGIFE